MFKNEALGSVKTTDFTKFIKKKNGDVKFMLIFCLPQILPIAALSAEQNATTDQQRANLNSSPLLAAASTSSAPSPSSPATGGLPTITTPLAGTSPPNPQGEEASKGLLNPVEIQAHKGSSLPVTSPSGASNRFLSNLLKDSHEADVNHNN